MENVMPIKTQSDLPAKEILEKENIFVMDESRATHQDIRVIEIGILNLMPLKEDTESAALAFAVEHTAADQCDIYHSIVP